MRYCWNANKLTLYYTTDHSFIWSRKKSKLSLYSHDFFLIKIWNLNRQRIFSYRLSGSFETLIFQPFILSMNHEGKKKKRTWHNYMCQNKTVPKVSMVTTFITQEESFSFHYILGKIKWVQLYVFLQFSFRLTIEMYYKIGV